MKMLEYFYHAKFNLLTNGLKDNAPFLLYRNRLFKCDPNTGIIYEYDRRTYTRCKAVAIFAYDNIFPIKKHA